MSLLGLDVGTSGCKAVAFDERGHALVSAGREYAPTACPPGTLEIDPNHVWNAVAACLHEVAGACRADPIAALSVSGFGEAAVPVDRAGQALMNGILFTDPRGRAELEALTGKLGTEELSRRTGLPPHPMYTLLRLMWLRDHQPELYRQTRSYLQFAEYVAFRLTGEAATGHSLAARTMAFNVSALAWDETILEAAGIPKDLFARALPGGAVIGAVLPSVAAELGLPKGVLVAAGGHDQPCAALGSGVIDGGQAIDSIGTSECITTSFDRPVLDRALFQMNYHCGPHVAPGKYVTFAYTMSAGALLQWFRDTIGRAERQEADRLGISVYELMQGRIGSEPTGLLVLPHLDGGGTPSLDPQSRGAILGLGRRTTAAEIYRAMLEGVTFEMRHNLECLGGLGIRVDSLKACGGGARSAQWLQMKADILNRPIATLENGEAGALGAAMLAGVAAGLWPDAASACQNMARESRRFEPDPKMAGRYEPNYRRYRRVYPAVRSILE